MLFVFESNFMLEKCYIRIGNEKLTFRYYFTLIYEEWCNAIEDCEFFYRFESLRGHKINPNLLKNNELGFLYLICDRFVTDLGPSF